MGNLVEIKKRIESVSSTIKVTKVMHMIATAKIAKVKQIINVVDRYNSYADEILSLYVQNTDYKNDISKFFEVNKKAQQSVLLLVFSSDKGTCGSINTNICKEMNNFIDEYKKQNKKITILPIGKKIVKYLQSNYKKLGVEIYKLEQYPDAEYCDGKMVGDIMNGILKSYNNFEYNEVSAISHKYKNIITCYVEKKQLLPLIKEEKDNKTNKDDKKKDAFINIEEQDKTPTSIIEYYIKTKLYNLYVSNIASIVSSRMNAMDNATKNGQEIIDDLRIQYNKGRQAHITSELSDIVSGFEAIS